MDTGALRASFSYFYFLFFLLWMVRNMDDAESRTMDKYLEMIEETNFIFDALQIAGNEATREVGFNVEYHLTLSLTAEYQLYEKRPAQLHYDQYAYLNEEELGERVELSTSLSDEEKYRTMDTLYQCIVLRQL